MYKSKQFIVIMNAGARGVNAEGSARAPAECALTTTAAVGLALAGPSIYVDPTLCLILVSDSHISCLFINVSCRISVSIFLFDNSFIKVNPGRAFVGPSSSSFVSAGTRAKSYLPKKRLPW